MEALELILLLLAAVAASSILDKLLSGLSLPLVQIVLGIIIALLVTTPLEQGLDPEILLILFIAPLHFNESRHADSGAIWRNRWGIASLAVGLVFLIIISVGVSLYALLPAIPLSLALAFGAAMGSTDAPAVMELSKDYQFGKRHETLLTGEAFFNDVTGTVVFQCAVAVAMSGTFSLAHAGEEFALDLFGGIFGGLIMGFAAWFVLELIRKLNLDNPNLHVTLELLIPFIIYLASEHFHIGGVIAVVMAGMMMSLLPHRHTAQTAKQELRAKSVWDTISFLLNGIIFVILGMQLPRIIQPATEGGLGNPWLVMGTVLAITCVLVIVRLAWIIGLDWIHDRQKLTRREFKEALAMAFAGAKGGITLSLVLTVPTSLMLADGLAARDAMASIASGVIACTLLLANFGVPALIPHKHARRRAKEKVDAEILLLLGVIRSIGEDAPHTGNVRGQVLDAPAAIDEPATAIVAKRYSDQVEELMPHASAEVQEQARPIVRACDAAYDAMDDIVQELSETDMDADVESPEDASSLSSHFKVLQGINDAVEDVQSQALARELELIKAMKTQGQLSGEQARSLREDVYVQQLTLNA